MKRRATGVLISTVAVAGLLATWGTRSSAQQASIVTLRSTTIQELRAWDAEVTRQVRNGDLDLRQSSRDPALPTRTLDRLQQFYQGVPVWGAEVVRDSEQGVTLSLNGRLSAGVDVSTVPGLDEAGASTRLRAVIGDGFLMRPVELVVLPLDSGEHRLAYTSVLSGAGGVWRTFIDASNGSELLRYSELEYQSAVGTGKGSFGDTKKISARQQGGGFVASDQLRPPVLDTYDMRFSLTRAVNVVDRRAGLGVSDLAADSDNAWDDPAVVDAHVHAGLSYDYYFKRFGRRGLDNADRPITIITNAVSQQGALSLSPEQRGQYAVNAFWCGTCGPGNGLIVLGNGIPPGFSLSGQSYTYFAGALDVVAHELGHGITDSSSRLIYRNESGALNEGFSDILGTGAEFFYQTPGAGRGRADYTMGEDVATGISPGVPDGFRSLADPRLFDDPDH